ncbi:MAG: pitrilysin family protein [Gemmatimonadota bacterium]|nr:pitrilysin family protein [Gemmatimonadota bacterium]
MRDTILENGLTVVAAPNSSIPVATIEIAFRGGAQTQLAEDDEGIPHILEHMLFKSYERSGRDWWSEKAGELDAIYNGTTGEETVTYYLTLPSENLDRGIELLGELVQSTRFTDDALTEEKRVVSSELQRRVSNPYFVAGQMAEMALWGPAFRRKNPIGNMLTIMGASADRLEAHYDLYYVPNNAALIVTGDVTASQVFASASEHLEGWDRAPDPFEALPRLSMAPIAVDSIFVVPAPASDVTFMIKWLGAEGREDPSAGLSGALFSELVNLPTSGTQRRLVDTGLFTFVELGTTRVRGVGSIDLTARTTPALVGAAAEALRLELQALVSDDYFTDEDLEAARKRLYVASALASQTSDGLAHALAAAWSGGRLDQFLDPSGSLSSQTAEDVRGYIDRYMAGKKKIVTLVMSNDDLTREMNTLVEAIGRWRTP